MKVVKTCNVPVGQIPQAVTPMNGMVDPVNVVLSRNMFSPSMCSSSASLPVSITKSYAINSDGKLMPTNSSVCTSSVNIIIPRPVTSVQTIVSQSDFVMNAKTKTVSSGNVIDINANNITIPGINGNLVLSPDGNILSNIEKDMGEVEHNNNCIEACSSSPVVLEDNLNSSCDSSSSSDDEADVEEVSVSVPKYIFDAINTYKTDDTTVLHFCLQCTESFPSSALLQKHLFSCHRVEGMTKPLDLMSHVLNKDPTRPYHCVICFKRCSTMVSLGRHANTHINKKYKCMVCKKTFRESAVLWRHMRYHETGRLGGPKLSKLPCVICKKYYSDVYALKRHHSVVHCVTHKDVVAQGTGT